MPRKTYTEEFKRDAVTLYENSPGTSIQTIAQEEVAHLSGLHRTYISLVERGGRNISVLNLLSITGVLEVDAGDMLTGLIREPRIQP